MIPFQLHNRLTSLIKKVGKTNTTPESIGLAFAIGTFIAVLPLFGAGIAVTAIIAVTSKHLNKIALFAPLLILNPVVLVPLYSFCFLVGNAIFAALPNTPVIDTPLLSYSVRFLAGNLLVAVLLSFGSYFLIKQGVIRYRMHQEKMANQKKHKKKRRKFLRSFGKKKR